MSSKRSFIGGSCAFQSGSVNTNAQAGTDIVNFDSIAPATAAAVPYMHRRTSLALLPAAGVDPLEMDTSVVANGGTAISYDAGTDTFTLNERGFYEVYLDFSGATTSGMSVGLVYLDVESQDPAQDPYLGAVVLTAAVAFDAATANNKFGSASRMLYFEAGTSLVVRMRNTLSASDTFVITAADVQFTKVK